MAGRQDPLPEHLARRELGRGWDSLTICRGCASAEAACLEERVPAGACHHVDKAFCAAWADSRTVLVGTKCGSLLSVDVAYGAWRRVPLLPTATTASVGGVVGGRAADAAAAVASVPPTHGHPPPAARRALGVHAVALAPSWDNDDDGAPVVAAAGAGPGRGADVAILIGRNSGGGEATADAAPPPFRPLPPLVGHADAVFGVAWLTSRSLLSASRDGTVKAWRLDDDGQEEEGGFTTSSSAAATSDAHGGGGSGNGGSGIGGASAPAAPLPLPRVRDVRATGEPGRAVSVASDGHLAVWDARAGAGGLCLAAPLLPVAQLRGAVAAAAVASAAAPAAATAASQPTPPPPPPEIANLAAAGDLVAVASRAGATLVDLRCGRECAHVTPPPPPPPPPSSSVAPPPRAAHDPAWARSVCLRARGGGGGGGGGSGLFPAELLSVGTADGRLLLYDLRACGGSGGEVLPSASASASSLAAAEAAAGASPSLAAAHALSDGHLDRDDPAYRARFAPLSFPAAAQAHAWEPPFSQGGGRHHRRSPANAAPRVFVAGGPLPSGVRGCYLGVWL